MRERLKLTLPLYSDRGGAAIAAWEVRDGDSGIARVASFIVAPGGAVIYRYVGANKTDRPTVADYIEAIDAHGAP